MSRLSRVSISRSRVSSVSFKTLTPKDADFMFKFILLGDTGVGKTCILQRFVDNGFSPVSPATIGIDFKMRRIDVGDTRVKVQTWDAAGHESFRSITSAYLRGAHGIFLVYDVTNQNSFQNLYIWLELVRRHRDPTTHPIIVLGTKCGEDDSQRTVSHEEAINWCLENDLLHLEVSAKTGYNIGRAFLFVTMIMIARHYRQNTRDITPIQQGWLQKKGDDIVGRFKNRYFLLQSDGKIYYGSKELTQEIREEWFSKITGSIPINEIESVELVSTPKKKFGLHLKCGKRTYVMSAQDERQQNIWVRSINRAKEPLMGAVIRFQLPRDPDFEGEINGRVLAPVDAVIIDVNKSKNYSHKIMFLTTDEPDRKSQASVTIPQPQRTLAWVQIDNENMRLSDEKDKDIPFELVLGLPKKFAGDALEDNILPPNSPLVNVSPRPTLKQLINAVLTSDLTALQPFMKRPNARELINNADAFGNYPILLAAAAGLPDPVILLVEAQADVNVKGKADWTALHWAAMKGDAVIVRELLSAGARVNARNEEGDTPLKFAAETREVSALKLLLYSQADMHMKNREKLCAFDIALAQIQQKQDSTTFDVLSKFFTFPEPKFVTFCNLSHLKKVSMTKSSYIYSCRLSVCDVPDQDQPICVPVVCKIPKGRLVGSDVWNELRVMQRLPQHPNLMSLLGVCMDFNVHEVPHCAIVTPCKFGGSLRNYMLNCRSADTDQLSWKTTIQFGLDIVRGIRHMHRSGYKHCDIASRNILLSETEEKISCIELDRTLIINDFALSRPLDSPSHSPLLPWRFCAPETLTTRITNSTTDIWMIGITFWEILTRCSYVPFEWCKTPKDILQHCEHQNLGPFPKDSKTEESKNEWEMLSDHKYEHEWTELIHKCCVYESDQRIGVDDVLIALKNMKTAIRQETEPPNPPQSDTEPCDSVANEGGDEKDESELKQDLDHMLLPITEEIKRTDSIPDLETGKERENALLPSGDHYGDVYVIFDDNNLSERSASSPNEVSNSLSGERQKQPSSESTANNILESPSEREGEESDPETPDPVSAEKGDELKKLQLKVRTLETMVGLLKSEKQSLEKALEDVLGKL